MNGKMHAVDIHTLLQHLNLRALTQEAGAVFGRHDASVCPLHPGADNPSAFHLYTGRDGRQRWHCFTRCPQGENDGDAISFYQRWRGVDFKTALHDLAHRAGATTTPQIKAPQRPPHTTHNQMAEPRRGGRHRLHVTHNTQYTPHPWQSSAAAFLRFAQVQLWSPPGEPALDYLHCQRGLSKDTLRTWGLGYNPRDVWQAAAAWGLPGGGRVWCPRGIVIPTLRDGAIWSVKVRRPLPSDPLARAIGAVQRLPRVKFSALRGGRATLFGADRLAARPLLLLAEGEFDALLAWQAARDLCDVASLGGAGRRLHAHDAALLTRAWIILTVYDADPAGAAGAASLRALSGRAVPVQPPAHDLTDYWRHGGDLRAWIAALVADQTQHLRRECSTTARFTPRKTLMDTRTIASA
jgi:hypothetical protein